MADLKETESTPITSEVPVKQQTPDTEKKASKPRKATGRQARAVRTSAAPSSTSTQASSPEAVASPTVRTARKTYSAKERAQKLGDIENQIGRGSSIKDAVKKAGISEQTYYQWKKAVAQVPQSDELKDLVKLEEENARLKQLLAERLRKENIELRKKLGLG